MSRPETEYSKRPGTDPASPDAGAAGIVAALAIFLGMSASLGFAVVPLGIGWMVAAGVVAVRRS